MSPLPLYATPGKPETALVLIQHQVDQTAQLVLSPNLRHSGLLKVMPPDLLQILVALLTFHDSRGEVKASASHLAEALGIHPDQAEQRLQQLCGYTFDGAPIVFPSTEHTFALSKRVGVPIDIAPSTATPTEPPYATVPREELVRRSRERYATPRTEAEAMVEEQLGVMPAQPVPEGREGEAYQAMLAVGMADAEARKLLAESPIEQIEEQIEWLPERGARNPARLLSAAIRGNYAPPDSPISPLR